VLKEHAARLSAADVCRKHGISDATFYKWRARFGGMEISDARTSALDARTTRWPGCEEPFGWGKTIGGLARPMLHCIKELDFKFTLTMAGYNLIRLPILPGVHIRITPRQVLVASSLRAFRPILWLSATQLTSFDAWVDVGAGCFL
jgi:hypothetical protein